MINSFNSMSKKERDKLIEFLVEGNTIEELAEQLLNELPQSEIDDIIREIKANEEE